MHTPNKSTLISGLPNGRLIFCLSTRYLSIIGMKYSFLAILLPPLINRSQQISFLGLNNYTIQCTSSQNRSLPLSQ